MEVIVTKIAKSLLTTKINNIMKKNVIARLKIKSDAIDNFIKSTETLITETRKESGCITYKLYQEIADEKNEFLFYEIYEDDKALQMHADSPCLEDFLNNISDFLLEKPIVEVHEMNQF
ncbi:hypothetical protein FPN187_contig00032-0020 [Flavobacterium psychrophilum]|nr:hypothetical protein FPN185_contig00067-0020 [Flavobacterium psychrophilum]GEJ35129.1 hypothetical protein FPN181_contig00028-0020 [Flavobacterium psychrophilum]GEJ37463.1 hypothetical protein FPN187_contig00032-0020 [Flavobacterium psychrophilum]GEJ40585.1 hypothetical protein FPN182_contig00041-0020 [Flavobacterium psychrophilum]GEJ41527.1 hypothetical protein FPN186_contig00043-0020 [Flavobacterium psychrophilum]